MIHCSAARPVTAVLATILAAATAAAAPAPVRVTDTAGLNRALGQAAPGTVIELAPGVYTGGVYAANVRGRAGAPVTVRSADASRPAVFEGGTIHLPDAAHLVLADFTVRRPRSNGLNLDDGGSFGTPAHHIVLRGLVVEDTGPRGNIDGIKLSGVDDLLVERCTVRGWGDGGGSGIDMVGCHRALFVGCTLESRTPAGSNGIQAKGGSSEVVVRRCRFRDAGDRAVQFGGSTGLRYFRPPGATYENRRSMALGNVVVGAGAAVAFVGTEDSAFLYNTVVRPRRYVLRILQEQRAEGYLRCRRNTFAHNLVVWKAGELRGHVNIGPDTHPETFRFASNLWFQTGGPAEASAPRLPAKETGGVYGRDPALADLANPGAPGPAFKAFGHTAPGEEEAWRKTARPMVEWAAEQVRKPIP